MQRSLAEKILIGLFTMFACSLSIADECAGTDASTYLIYVYDESDANFLQGQTCKARSGDSRLETTLKSAECLCYDKSASEVSAELTSRNGEGGPIPVLTRKLKDIGGPVTCRDALSRCELNCRQAAAQVAACGNLLHPGINLN